MGKQLVNFITCGCELSAPFLQFTKPGANPRRIGEVEVTWPEVTSVTGSMFCACATGSCVISAMVGPFDRKWQIHVTGNMFCACPAFSRRFFLSNSTVVTWLPDVTEGHLIPSRFPWMCACATGSCATPVVTPSEVSMGCYLRRPRSIIVF
jgi:hypothetical protein